MSERERSDAILIDAAKQVGPALFFSLLIIVVSFLPVFLLEAQEGRMFRPLAWTKTLAVGFSSLLAITLVPVLMVILIRGRLRPESRNPISRVHAGDLSAGFATLPEISQDDIAAESDLSGRDVSRWPSSWAASSCRRCLKAPRFTCRPLCRASRSRRRSQLLQEQDRILRIFPEVESVFGAVGRSDSATDNAPLDMYDTTVMLKPREQWPPGMTYEKLIQEMDEKLQFPGLSNTWTMPVENRLDMELTGIKTPVGMKIQGPNLERHPATRRADPAGSFGACRRCVPSLPSGSRKASTSMSK